MLLRPFPLALVDGFRDAIDEVGVGGNGIIAVDVKGAKSIRLRQIVQGLDMS